MTFAEKVAGLGPTERAKEQAARGRRRRRPGWTPRGKFAEADRAALEALETTGTVGPESAEVARAGIESAGAGGQGTTRAEPRRPTSGR